MSLRDQIRKILQLHTHPDSRAEILTCFDEMSGEPTQQQVVRWCEEIRGFHESLVAASKFEANELGNLHAIDEALTSNACEPPCGSPGCMQGTSSSRCAWLEQETERKLQPTRSTRFAINSPTRATSSRGSPERSTRPAKQPRRS